MRLESSADSFLSHSKDMALLCRSVCHILFLIKVIQNEVKKKKKKYKFQVDSRTFKYYNSQQNDPIIFYYYPYFLRLERWDFLSVWKCVFKLSK